MAELKTRRLAVCPDDKTPFPGPRKFPRVSIWTFQQKSDLVLQAFKQAGEDEAAAAEDQAKREAKEAEKLVARTKKISLSEDSGEKVAKPHSLSRTLLWINTSHFLSDCLPKKAKEKKSAPVLFTPATSLQSGPCESRCRHPYFHCHKQSPHPTPTSGHRHVPVTWAWSHCINADGHPCLKGTSAEGSGHHFNANMSVLPH